MQPENRIKLADELFAQIAEWKFPADRFLNDFFRRNRFAGSKDRRFIQDEIYKKIRDKGECPEWLKKYLPENFEGELAALQGEAAVDIRVNSLKAKRPMNLPPEGGSWGGLEVGATPLSPIGLRLKKRQALRQDGSYEVQDEGSQLASLYVQAKPGEWVLDYCAGAGGKALALVAEMENSGKITAYDIDARKLKILEARAKRAGAKIINVEKPEGDYDAVVVDAPCSGIGTWRRAPDAKWRLSEEKLRVYIQQQEKILQEAAQFVRKGGRLIYITCSLLTVENEGQVEKFLIANSEFTKSKEYLRLSPLTTNTDGFFAASLVRV